MATPQSSRNHPVNFRRAFALTPALALAALAVMAAIWGYAAVWAARPEPKAERAGAWRARY